MSKKIQDTFYVTKSQRKKKIEVLFNEECEGRAQKEKEKEFKKKPKKKPKKKSIIER